MSSPKALERNLRANCFSCLRYCDTILGQPCFLGILMTCMLLTPAKCRYTPDMQTCVLATFAYRYTADVCTCVLLCAQCLQILPFITAPFLYQLPQTVFIYWVTSFLITTAQVCTHTIPCAYGYKSPLRRYVHAQIHVHMDIHTHLHL
jgi:hypothetical protein